MRKYHKDFTKGSILKHLIFFGLPILFANLMQAIYSITDMIVVGRIVGSVGLAAISNVSMIVFVINSICIGLTMGGSVVIAKFKGAGDETAQKKTVATLFSMSMILAIVIIIIGMATYRPLLVLLDVPQEAFQDSCDYMWIICCGTVFVFGYNAVSSVMRGLGDSRSPLLIIFIASIVNGVLSILFVGHFNMGTKGAAYGTIIAQAVSLILAIVHFRRHNASLFGFRLRDFQILPDSLLSIGRIGLPFALQIVIVNVSYLLVTGMLNRYGVVITAASGIGLKVNTFAAMPCWAIGQAVMTMVGQNLGAGNMERVKQSTLTGLGLNFMVTIATVAMIQIFAVPIIRLFDPGSNEVIEQGVLYLRICCSLNCLFYVAMYTFDAFATGSGSATFAMCNSILESVMMRVLFSWILGMTLGYGFMGIYIGHALSAILPAVLGTYFFYQKTGNKSYSPPNP